MPPQDFEPVLDLVDLLFQIFYQHEILLAAFLGMVSCSAAKLYHREGKKQSIGEYLANINVYEPGPTSVVRLYVKSSIATLNRRHA